MTLMTEIRSGVRLRARAQRESRNSVISVNVSLKSYLIWRRRYRNARHDRAVLTRPLVTPSFRRCCINPHGPEAETPR